MPGTISSQIREEGNWQAQSDADTLATAGEIISDPERLNKAKIAAANMVADKLAQVRNLMDIAGQTFNQTYKGFTISADQSSIK